MDADSFFKVIAIVSPFAAAGLTYLLSLRTKKNEYLYQNRLPAFKEIASVLIKIRKYCEGKIALERGNEFSPYYDEEGSALSFRAELADARQLNEIFLTDKSIRLLDKIDVQLGLTCSAELGFSGIENRAEGWSYIGSAYTGLLETVENSLKVLYKEVGLPNS